MSHVSDKRFQFLLVKLKRKTSFKKSFYLEIISNLKESYQNTNSTKNTHVSFTQIHLLLTFWSICFRICSFLSLPTSLTLLQVPTSVIFSSEPRESKLHVLWSFIAKYFSVCFPKIRTFSHITTAQLSTSGNVTASHNRPFSSVVY